MRERENWQCMCSGFELRHMNRRKQMIKKRRAAAAAATKENGKETRREFVYNCAAAFCNYPKEESKKEDPKELCGPRARYWKPKRRRNKKKKRRKQRRHQRLVWGKVDRPKKNKNKKDEISNDAWEINHRNCCWRIHQMWAQCWLEAADGAPTHFPSFTVVDDDEAFARRKQGKVLELFNSSPTCCHVTGMKHLSMFKTSSNIDQRERERPKLSF